MCGYICSTPKNYENKYTTIQCTNLYCRRFGLSMFRCVDVLVCRCFGMSTFFVCFGLLTFWFVDVLVCRRFGCQRFGLSTFWPVTYKRVHVNTSKPGYKYGHHFADDISKRISLMAFFCNLALHEFYFLNIIYILLHIYLILSTFFQHSNILTRASHHWCLASNIVLVLCYYADWQVNTTS